MTEFAIRGKQRSRPNDTVRAVHRAARLLEAIANASLPATAAELAKAVGLNVSTCHHLLNTLEVESLITRASDSRYHLGPQLLFLAGRVPDGPSQLTQLVDELEAMNAQTRETSYLVAWHGDHLTVLAARLGLEPVVVGDIELGYREHAHAKASGKVILANSDERVLSDYLARNTLTKLTPKTVVGRRVFERQLEGIKRLGFAEEIEEYALGVACLAAPIVSAKGTVLGALSISVPIERFEERRRALIEGVVAAAKRASERLGAR